MAFSRISPRRSRRACYIRSSKAFRSARRISRSIYALLRLTRVSRQARIGSCCAHRQLLNIRNTSTITYRRMKARNLGPQRSLFLIGARMEAPKHFVSVRWAIRSSAATSFVKRLADVKQLTAQRIVRYQRYLKWVGVCGEQAISLSPSGLHHPGAWWRIRWRHSATFQGFKARLVISSAPSRSSGHPIPLLTAKFLLAAPSLLISWISHLQTVDAAGKVAQARSSTHPHPNPRYLPFPSSS